MKSITILLLATCLLYANAANYAVIVAGSNEFYNYRHQSDACHAYHVLIDDGGFAPENIILMSYNDVAKDPSNPFPNTLYNKPTTGPGVDVNAGCVVDYEGDDVTAANYLNIIKGNSAAMSGIGSGKVLTSTQDDKVFLNFVDHGGAGLIAFPVGDYLYAQDLQDALNYMTQNKMYKELVYYMEACESGSMFTSLPTDTKIYAVSASSPSESSWGTYCPPDDVVNGTEIGSCLGDTFSINWMEDSDAFKDQFSSRSLQDQFVQVAKLTTQSSAMQWGDVSFTTEPIGNFLGGQGSVKSVKNFMDKMRKVFKGINKQQSTQIDSRDIEMNYFINKFKKNPTIQNQQLLAQQIENVEYFDTVFAKLQQSAQLTGTIGKTTNWNCYKRSISLFSTHCRQPNTYAMKYFRYLYEQCENVVGLGYEKVYSNIISACQQEMTA